MTRSEKKRRVEALIEHWHAPLGLANWTFQTTFDGGAKEQATCIADPEYRNARLNFNLRRIGPHEIEELVCHELMHCHGWALGAYAFKWAANDGTKREVVRQAEELLTTAVSRAFLPLLPKVVT